MKRILNFSIAAFAFIALSLSCAKETEPANENINNGEESQETVVPVARPIIISATLESTKVTFNPTFDGSNKPTGMAHTWEEGDKLRVTEVGNEDNTCDFDLVDGIGTNTGTFSGAIADAEAYNVTVIPQASPSSLGATQTQASDGDTAHLKFVASATGVTNLKDFTLTETSNIIGFIAKLPAGVAATINQLVIDKSTDDFETTSTLTITLESTSDANEDDILEVYANVPSGWAIAAGTKMFLRFRSTNTKHTVYTRYQEFASAATINAGQFNYLKLNCSQTDKYAGKDDDGTSSHPYLIADGYQLQALDGLLSAKASGTTVYAELVDNIDLSVYDNWSPIDASSRYVHLEGNNKTIDKLKITKPGTGNKAYAGLFCIFYGTAQNITFSNADVKGDGEKGAGIFSGYLCSSTGAADCTIDNVKIEAGKVNGNGKVCGALASSIGQNNSSTFSVTISNVEVSGTTVTTTNDCAGLIALAQGASSANRTLSISHCNIINSTVSSEGTGIRVGGLIGVVPSTNTTISDISVKGTNVSGLSKAKAVGGIVGLVSNAADFDRCTYKKNGDTAATVTGPTKHNNETDNKSNDSDAEQAGGAYVGGIAGEVSGAASFDDCHVKNAKVTITTPSSNTDYWKDLGGAFGYVHNNNATIGFTKSCSVDSTNVAGSHFAGGFVGFLDGGTIEATVTDLTLSGRNYTGGFVGQLKSGTIKKSSVAGNNATDLNATVGGFAGRVLGGSMDRDTTSLQMGTSSAKVGTNAGGFAGQIWGGSLEKCASSGAVYSSANTVGGFVGNVTGGTISSCSASGNVTVDATNNIGGFAGMASQCNLSSCHASGTVSSKGTYIAGFIGRLTPGDKGTATISSCYATGNVSSTSQQVGGFVGRVEGAGTSNISSCYATGSAGGANYVGGLIGYQTGNVTVSKCYATGNVTVASTGGGLIGRGGGGLTVENCYATGSVSGANRRRGGIVGWVEASTVSISNCYTTSNLSGTFEMGGVVGLANITGVTIQNCAAWNGTITATNRAATNWSSAAIVGVSYLDGTYTNNYRSPSMDMTVYWGTNANCSVNLPTSFQHPDVSASAPLTDPNGDAVTSSTMRPYHGKCDASKTLSQLAKTTLGWSGDIWNFDKDLPTLIQ